MSKLSNVQRRLLEQDVAQFLHRRLHKSQKILICKSDAELAKEIVGYFEEGREAINAEDDQRAGVPAR